MYYTASKADKLFRKGLTVFGEGKKGTWFQIRFSCFFQVQLTRGIVWKLNKLLSYLHGFSSF